MSFSGFLKQNIVLIVSERDRWGKPIKPPTTTVVKGRAVEQARIVLNDKGEEVLSPWQVWIKPRDITGEYKVQIADSYDGLNETYRIVTISEPRGKRGNVHHIKLDLI